jgi:hypothetical protein
MQYSIVSMTVTVGASSDICLECQVFSLSGANARSRLTVEEACNLRHYSEYLSGASDW